MCKIFIITGLVLILTQFNVNAEVSCQTTSPAIVDQYSLKITQINDENLYLVNVGLELECYVKIIISDPVINEEICLLEDTMQPGEYNIYYKSKENNSAKMYYCNMKVYNNQMELVYSKELIIPVK